MSKQIKLYLFAIPLTLFFLISLNFHLSGFLLANFNSYDAKRVLELILLSYFALLFLCLNSKQQTLLACFWQWPVLIRFSLLTIFFLGIVSSLVAPLPKMALLEFSTYLLLFYFAFFIVDEYSNDARQTNNILLTTIFLGVITYTIIFFSVYIYLKNNPHDTASLNANFFPGFVNPRFFSQFLVWTLPLITIPLQLQGWSRYKKLLVAVIAVAWWLIALTSATKSIMVALACAVVFALCLFHKHALRWLLIQVIILLIAVTAYYVLFVYQSNPSLAHALSPLQQSTTSRLALWSYAWDLIKTHPILGVGPMHFAYYPNPIAAHPHNTVLLFASEWGLPATILAAIIFVYGIWKWWQTCRRQVNLTDKLPWLLALTVGFVAGACDSLMDGIVVTPLSQVMLAIYIGWMIGICSEGVSEEHEVSLSAYLLISIGALLGLSGITIGIFPAIFTLSQQEIFWLYQQQFHATLMPRFWLQGLLR